MRPGAEADEERTGGMRNERAALLPGSLHHRGPRGQQGSGLVRDAVYRVPRHKMMTNVSPPCSKNPSSNTSKQDYRINATG